MSEKDSEGKDRTSVGGGIVVPKLPGQGAANRPAPESATGGGTGAAPADQANSRGDATRGASGAQPKLPKLPGADAPAAADEGQKEEVWVDEPTVLQPQAVSDRFKLLRVQPQGHAGVEPLTKQRYYLGRSRNSDIVLFSDTASREHAEIERRGDRWVVSPRGDKIVLAGGELVKSERVLEHRMLLQLGGDELVYLDDEVALRGDDPPTRTPPQPARVLWPWVIGAAALIAAAAALFLLKA